MARSVGSIEVTVEANTGKLKAQLVKAGEEGGKEAAKAIDEALDDIEAEVGVGVEDGAIQKVKEQIEESLDDLLASVGVSVDDGDIERVQEQIEESLDDLLASVGVTVEDGDIQETQQRIEESLDDLLASVGISLDDVSLEEAKVRAEQTLDGLLASVGITVDDIALQEARIKLESNLDDLLVSVGVTADDVDIETTRMSIEAAFDGLQAEFGIDYSKADVERVRLSLDQSLDGLLASVGVDVDAIDAAIARERLDESMDGVTAEVDVSIDMPSKLAADALLEENMKETGKKSGDGFGKEFSGGILDGLSSRMKLIVGLVAGFSEPVITALQGLVGSSVAILGSLFSATSAAAGAAVPVLLGFGAAAGAVIAGINGVPGAMKDVSKAFAEAKASGEEFSLSNEKVAKALAQLTPAAQDFVVAFAQIKPQLGAIQDNLQQQLFKGLGDDLRSLSDSVLPGVGDALSGMADTVNQFLRGVASDLGSVDFGGLLKGVTPAIDSILDGFRSLIKAVAPFFKAATPAAKELATSFELAAASLGNMIQSGSDSGAITDFLLEGVESLRAWGDLLGEVTESLFLLFDAGKSEGDGMVKKLSEIIAKWNDWMRLPEGQNALKDFFAESKDILADMKPLLDAVGEAFSNLSGEGSEDRFGTLIDGLSEVIVLLSELFVKLGEMSILQTTIDLVVVGLTGVVAVLDLVPAPLLAALGAILVLNSGMSKMVDSFIKGAIEVAKFARAVVEMSLTSQVALGALALAATAAILIWQSMGSKQREIAQRAKEVAEALEGTVDAQLETVTSANLATIAVTAMGDALTSAGADGEKLSEGLGTFGKQASDSIQVLGDIAKDPVTALQKLGEEFGLTAEQANTLARAVDGVGDTTVDHDNAGQVAMIARSWSDAWGIGADELERIARELEELQDQSEKTELDKAIRQFLANAAAGSDLAEANLAIAESQLGVKRTGEDLFPLYEAFVTLMGQSKIDADNAAAALKGYGDAMAAAGKLGVEGAGGVEEMTLSAQEWNQMEFKDPDLEAIDGAFRSVGNAARDAAESADQLREALDLLNGGALDFQEAGDKLGEGVNKIKENLAKAKEGADGYSRSLEGSSEGALKNRAAIRDQISAMYDWVASARNAGKSNDEINAGFEMSRQVLIDLVSQFDTGTQSAEAYVDALNLTPEKLETLIETPGGVEAVLGLENLNQGMDDLDGKEAKPKVDYVAIALARYQTQQLFEDLDALPDTTVSVDIPGLDTQIVKVGNLRLELDKIDGHTVSASVIITADKRFEAMGGVSPEGFINIAGEAGPEWMVHQGQRSLITSPTIVPHHSIIQPIQAAELRSLAGNRRSIDDVRALSPVTLNVYPQSADPRAVATSVINRVASLVNR